ncbi:amino acid adenylation domain-containing protein [Erwinia billingiae]|uniref:amino acid adenylation domain-containing protein n=1 Tax=Erwinia billingiae TaxID=182337 RepID=UPI002247C248|nr:amino acid adenylation domain-containing protein [Erwinia billingiae]MCX0498185.1 amino acid adenylation domain-containing protein [Erwinia billingiae]
MRLSIYPLTSSQQAVWLDQALTPDTPCYNVGGLWRIDSPLDASLLHRAINLVLQQHDALKIKLTEGEEGINQTTVHKREFILECHDLSRELRPVHTARELLNARLIQPFKMYGELLWRSSLVKVNATTSLWLVNAHHIIADGTSVSLLGRMIIDRYKSLLLGQALAVTDACAGYTDFIGQDRDYLASSRYPRDRAYWLSRFADAPASLLERRNGFAASEAWPSTQILRTLPQARYQQLTAFAGRYGASPMHFFSALMACWFARQWQAEDFTLGVPVHNRSGARHKQTLGMFSAMLPVRLQIDTAQPFSSLIRQVSAELRRSYRHQRFPVAELNRHLRLSQQGRRQLYDMSFSLETFPTDIELNGTPLKVEALHHGFEQMPVAVYLRHYHPGDDPVLECNVNQAWFSEQEAGKIADRLLHLLNAILDAPPEQPMALLPLLLPDEQHAILNLWNDTAADWPLPEGIHRWFEQQVSKTPDAVALSGVAEMTYATLNAEANRLAHWLRAGGIQPDDRIALCVSRSADMVIALLAILKAGAAYVPLDPDYPQDRLQHMLSDCGAKQVLVDDVGARALQPIASLPLVHLLNDRPRWQAGSTDNLPALADDPQRSLAYVIYTSGSTGKPKGVMNEHLAVMNRLQWMQDAYPLTAQDRVLQKTPFSFDVSVWEFFWPLMVGARLAMAKPGGHQDPGYLSDFIQQQQITTLHFVPSMLQLFLRHGEMAHCRSLRRLFCSGEALPLTAVERCHQQLPAVELHNLYGPTEAAVDVSYWHCKPGEIGSSVPIGRPVANTQLYILDANLQLLPPGISGELHIGGVQVARGYLNREELSQQRFIADPLSAQPDARLYKTGDLARWLDDGNIEYLGRNDFQVKIHGLRIELGEIEQQIVACPQVEDCVVLACEDDDGDKRLIAWVVARPDPQLADSLRQQIGQSLPEFMIPASFVRVDALPLSPNGKLDRKALPMPAAEAQRAFTPPATAQERLLAACWGDLLGVSAVGRDDDFFDLGGHSLHAIQLMMRLRKRGIEVEMKTLFAHPKLRQQAEALSQPATEQSPQWVDTPAPLANLLKQLNRPQQTFDLIQPLNAATQGDDLWMIHPAVVGCEIYQDLADSLSGTFNVLGINNYNLHNRPHIPTLAALASYYLQHMLQWGMPTDRPVRLLGWSLGGVIALEIAAQLEQRGYTQLQVCLLDSLYQTAVQQRVAPGMLASLLKAIGLEGDAAKRAIQAEETELSINNQAVSAPLHHTQVTLLKAMQFFDLSDSGTAEGDEVLAIKDNGVGALCPSLKIVPLAANHHSIILCHQEIAAALSSSAVSHETHPH